MFTGGLLQLLKQQLWLGRSSVAAGQVVVNLEYFYSGVARKCPQVVAIKVLGGEKKKKL